MYYPVMLDIRDKKVLVVGGGRVALRKTKSLLASGGRVYLVSPEIDREFKDLDEITYIKDRYKIDYIKDAFIVIGATNNREVNLEIARDCKDLDKLCNIVDNKEKSSFITPAVVDKEGLLLTISTNGGFPSLSKYIKKDLEERYKKFDNRYLDLLEEVRAYILKYHYDCRLKIFPRLIKMDYENLLQFYKDIKKEGKTD